MGKRPNQKIRLLLMRELLLRETDEEHRLAIPRFLEMLAARGIEVERKSLYDDMEALQAYGMDVQMVRGRTGGYFLGSRLFELPELKLLVDAVQSSRFITAQKSARLIHKLETLASRYQAVQLQRQVEVSDRVKNMNESIYYVVDAIHEAISQEKKISFRYRSWVVDATAPGGFSSQDRRNGRHYVVSPWMLVWSEENYYLVAFDEETREIRHFRVDKIHQQRILNAPREGRALFEQTEPAQYAKSVFGMFGGQAQDVELEMADHLVGVLVDRFGRGLVLHPGSREGRFRVRVSVVPSPAFYGWVMSFGDEAELVGPAPLRDEFAEYTARISALYRAKE